MEIDSAFASAIITERKRSCLCEPAPDEIDLTVSEATSARPSWRKYSRATTIPLIVPVPGSRGRYAPRFGALFCADSQSGPILTCVGLLAPFGKLTYPPK